MKKTIRYTIIAAVAVFVVYNSVYFRSLDDVERSDNNVFDAPAFARDFFDHQLLPHLTDATELTSLVTTLNSSPERAFAEHSHALAIGNIRYFLVRGEGTVVDLADDAVKISIPQGPEISIATEFVYGNAIRDASGLLKLSDFDNTADINRVSEEIDKIVRNEVLPPFKIDCGKGDVVAFVGAMELNQAHPDLNSLEVIPIELKIIR